MVILLVIVPDDTDIDDFRFCISFSSFLNCSNINNNVNNNIIVVNDNDVTC